MTMHVEAGDSEMRITLTDEALPSLPLYVSKVREPRGRAELEALLDAVALELRSKAHVALYRVPDNEFPHEWLQVHTTT